MQQTTRRRKSKRLPKFTRLSFGELEEFLQGGDIDMRAHDSTGIADNRVMPGYIARACGVTRNTVQRWRHEGLSLHQAYRAACALGVHPLMIWSNWGQEEESCHA